MKYNKKGIILALALVTVFIVLVTTDEPPPPGICGTLEREINTMFEKVNYCDSDDDCVQYSECPFTRRFYNKNADLSEIENKIGSFRNKCSVCPDALSLTPREPEGDLRCISNKCVVAGSTELPRTYLVTRVIDGDTVAIEGGDVIRYIGLDAPETVHPSEPVGCFGEEASNRNKELVEGKKVRLEIDISETDKYDRLLRYVWVDDIFVNDYLIREGYAFASTYPPDVKYSDQFVEAQREAKENKRGLWSECEEKTIIDDPPPPSPKPPTEPPQSVCDWQSITSDKIGLEVIEAENAGDYYGETKIVEGRVSSTRKYNNPALFINFCEPYPNHCFTSIVWKNDISSFPENASSLYYNKTVRVSGLIADYNGKPQIILYDPSQIEVCQ